MPVFGIHMVHERVQGHGLKMLQKLRSAARAAVDESLVQFKAELIAEMQRPKTGRWYRKRGRMHQASAPGEAPAIDTAKYVNSIYIVGPFWAGWEAQGFVTTRMKERAEQLEYGTSRMEPRPVWRIVRNRVRRRVVAKRLKFRMR
jgi:hypothetical protein